MIKVAATFLKIAAITLANSDALESRCFREKVRLRPAGTHQFRPFSILPAVLIHEGPVGNAW